MNNLYMHTLDGRPAMYQPGTYICYINSYQRVTSKEMFRTSLKQIYAEQRASAAWRKANGSGVRSGYGYIRIKLNGGLPRGWWVTNKDAHPNNQRVIGPFTTVSDAAVAREYIEHKDGDHTFWLEELGK